MYNAVSELYNKSFEHYYDKYYELSDVKKFKLEQKLKPITLTPYDCNGWFNKDLANY